MTMGGASAAKGATKCTDSLLPSGALACKRTCRSLMKDDAISPIFLLAVPAMDFSCCTSCRACPSSHRRLRVRFRSGFYNFSTPKPQAMTTMSWGLVGHPRGEHVQSQGRTCDNNGARAHHVRVRPTWKDSLLMSSPALTSKSADPDRAAPDGPPPPPPPSSRP